VFIAVEISSGPSWEERSTLTKDHPSAPNHPRTICSRHNWPGHYFLLWGRNTIHLQPSVQIVSYQRRKGLNSSITFSDWHSQPRFPSCGHAEPNVDSRACVMRSPVGSSIEAGLELLCWMSIIIAHPQSGACLRCSVMGLSSSSHPSSARWHSKHVVLSGFVSYGL